ncbi:AMIN-like domain-containing (lipo)protein [Nonomuraea bangladeshensis]|uniref:AMIN-like domain-containing (lipo)protein n=1 Tax=Nonomuraea bangladeshensis TaxID=404385 RepID=UPI003C2D3FEB
MRPSSPSGVRPSPFRVAVQLAGIAALAVLTACGPATQTAFPGGPPASRSASEDPREESPEDPSEDADRGPSGGSTDSGGSTSTSTSEVDVERDDMDPAIVTSVRYAAHDTYDRVVIDLDGDVPGYNVKWVDEFVQDGSGRRIDVRGGAYLQITLFPAHAHDENGVPTWKGGPVYPADLGNLTDVVRTGDFEGRVGVGLVLARQAAFQIEEQGGPNRLVLDVAH